MWYLFCELLCVEVSKQQKNKREPSPPTFAGPTYFFILPGSTFKRRSQDSLWIFCYFDIFFFNLSSFQKSDMFTFRQCEHANPMWWNLMHARKRDHSGTSVFWDFEFLNYRCLILHLWETLKSQAMQERRAVSFWTACTHFHFIRIVPELFRDQTCFCCYVLCAVNLKNGFVWEIILPRPHQKTN